MSGQWLIYLQIIIIYNYYLDNTTLQIHYKYFAFAFLVAWRPVDKQY